jgi:hypothetical protein
VLPRVGPGGNLVLLSGVARIAMELFLNIVWMLVAAGLLVAWRTRWIHERRGSSRRSLQEWSAISLALVVLFFAVSMTDDMHSEIVALEECSASKRDFVHALGAHAAPDSGAALHASSWAIVPPVPFVGLSSSLQKAEPAVQLRSSSPRSSQASGRAPPVSFL